MKQFIIKSAILAASIGMVVSCSSTNTQHENTMIGAGTGAVIGGLAGSAIGAGTGQVVAVGVGAVAGALVGGYVGSSMDSSDKVKASQALEHNPKQKSTHWKNKKTGAHYTMLPTSEHIAYKGNSDCRNYTTTGWIHGKKQQVDGVACRKADGSWQTMQS